MFIIFVIFKLRMYFLFFACCKEHQDKLFIDRHGFEMYTYTKEFYFKIPTYGKVYDKHELRER